MKKETLYKIFAIAMFLVFIGEIYFFWKPQSTTEPLPGERLKLNGTVITNITIEQYEPFLLIQAELPEIENITKKYKENNLISDLINTPSGFLLNITNKEDIPTIANEFFDKNITVLGNAIISTEPTLLLEGEDISTQIEGSLFRISLEPIFKQGTKILVSFDGYSENKKLYSMANLKFLPVYKIAKIPAAELANKTAAKIIEIPWEKRAEVKNITKNISGIKYSEKSYVELNQPLSEKEKQKLLEQPYITSVRNNIISVKNDFEDKEALLNLFNSNNITLDIIFPNSTILSGDKTEELIKRLNENNISYNIKKIQTATFKLPKTINIEGNEYLNKINEITIQIDSLEEENLEDLKINLSAKLQIYGDIIKEISDAKLD